MFEERKQKQKKDCTLTLVEHNILYDAISSHELSEFVYIRQFFLLFLGPGARKIGPGMQFRFNPTHGCPKRMERC